MCIGVYICMCICIYIYIYIDIGDNCRSGCMGVLTMYSRGV